MIIQLRCLSKIIWKVLVWKEIGMTLNGWTVYSKDNKYSILVTFVLISHQLDFENESQ